MNTEIKTKIELQKAIMLNGNRFWNVNLLTDLMRSEITRRDKEYGSKMKSINHSSVERNIRHYREPKHALKVEMRQLSDNTYEYKISHEE